MEWHGYLDLVQFIRTELNLIISILHKHWNWTWSDACLHLILPPENRRWNLGTRPPASFLLSWAGRQSLTPVCHVILPVCHGVWNSEMRLQQTIYRCCPEFYTNHPYQSDAQCRVHQTIDLSDREIYNFLDRTKHYKPSIASDRFLVKLGSR